MPLTDDIDSRSTVDRFMTAAIQSISDWVIQDVISSRWTDDNKKNADDENLNNNEVTNIDIFINSYIPQLSIYQNI